MHCQPMACLLGGTRPFGVTMLATDMHAPYVGAYALPIEMGRRLRMARVARVCPLCPGMHVGDERHYVP